MDPEAIEETQDPIEDNLDNPEIEEGQPAGAEDSFYTGNPEELPDELKPAYRSMQADYTRKMQSMSAGVDDGELATLKQQAGFYQKFMTDPTFRQQLTAAADVSNPAGQQASATSLASNYGDTDKLIANYEPDSVRDIKAIAAMAMDELIMPQLQAAMSELKEVRRDTAMKDWQAVTARYDGAEAHADAVAQFLGENPNFLRGQPATVRFEKALQMVSDLKPKAPAKQPQQRISPDKRRAAAMGNGVPAGNARPSTEKQTLADLFREARKDLGMV